MNAPQGRGDNIGLALHLPECVFVEPVLAQSTAAHRRNGRRIGSVIPALLFSASPFAPAMPNLAVKEH